MIAIHRASSEPAVQPDHPERHDLWGPIVIARFSAHRKYLCRSLRLCTPGEHFHLWTRGRRKKRKRKKRRDREETERAQWSAHNNGSGDWEKWNVTTWSARKTTDMYISKNTYMYMYVHTSESSGPPARDVLFRSATNGPRRLPFNDYKCIWDTCITFIHYHLPFSNRLRVASYN